MRHLGINPPVIPLAVQCQTDPQARLVYADYWLERGRDDIARLWLGPGILPVQPLFEPTKRLEKLPRGARSRLKAWAKQQIAYGLSTMPADRDLFTASIFALYSTIGRWLPEIRWVAHPGEVARATDGVDSQLDVIGMDLLNAVGDDIWMATTGEVRTDVRINSDAIWNAVRVTVGTPVAIVVRHAFGTTIDVGQFEISTPAHYLSFIDILGLQIDSILTHRLRAWMGTCQSACWWHAGRNVVTVSERPRILRPKPLYVEWEGFTVGNP
jgi:hypothetical protein